MKIKINAFLKWLALNEKSIAQIPDLRPDKKLFWIYWIHWHLSFYLPRVQFVLWFRMDSARPVLHLFSQQEYEVNRFLFSFRNVEIIFHKTTAGIVPAGWGDFEQYVIEDITAEADYRTGEFPIINFAEVRFRDSLAFAKFEQCQLLMSVWFSNSRCETHPIFVKLSKGVIIQDHKLLNLREFEYYVDQINRSNG